MHAWDNFAHMKFFAALWRIVRWPLAAMVIIFVALFIFELFRTPQRTAAAVAAIHAQKLTKADVDGSHLPPQPDPKLVDATVAGVDANSNGIRDDVELAIFKKYPNDLKLRSAALQYAMTEQMFLTRVNNTATWKAVAEENGRANACLIELKLGYKTTNTLGDYVESLVANTQNRKSDYEKSFRFTTSFGDAPGRACDVDF